MELEVVENIAGILSLTGCIWLLVSLFVAIRVQRFIVKRYEKETGLLNTVYFTEHATFTRSLPGFISSALYVAHLISFVWIWDYCKRKKPYRDIKESSEVTHLFSDAEIRRVKWFVINGAIVLAHFAAYFVISFFWPESFN
jgi:hypothetical protein